VVCLFFAGAEDSPPRATTVRNRNLEDGREVIDFGEGRSEVLAWKG
jgi:hypothetical protein